MSLHRRRPPRTDWTGWTPRGEEPSPVERRQDLTTRDRIDEIMAAVLRFGAQFRVIVIVGLLAAAVAAGAFSVVLWKLDKAQTETRAAQQGLRAAQRDVAAVVRQIAAVVRQIQFERERNTLLSCQSEKRQNAAIRNFVKTRTPADRRDDPDVVDAFHALDATFPDRDCEREQRERVRGDRP